jgi:threonine dehydrogenase-like Zn-dependent dehydrogenase
MYHNELPQYLKKGDIFVHEFMGIIDEVGPEVKNFKVGDRVVVSAVICCGECFYCKSGRVSCCDMTNPCQDLDKLYGHRLAGIFGYSHLLGGFEGGQAEYVRVPLADNTCLKVPNELPDEKVLFLSDIACTGWHANVLGEVSKGQNVAIWGLGPVGLMASMWAKFRGARVIGIDQIPHRLALARKELGIETIDFSKENVTTRLQQLCPGGPDVAIEAAGFRYTKSLTHAAERSLNLEKDTPEILTECIMNVRKGGNLSIVGDYFLTANQFPIGAMMEKNITVRGGQVHVQSYWKELLGYIQQGKVDPTFVISHRMSLDDADKAYRIFDKKEDNAVKIILKPSLGATTATTK